MLDEEKLETPQFEKSWKLPKKICNSGILSKKKKKKHKKKT